MNRKNVVLFAAAALLFGVCGCGTIQQEKCTMEKTSTITDVHDFLKKTQTYYLATIDGQVLYFKDATAVFSSFHEEPVTVKF